MSTHSNVKDDAAAYVLGTLDPDEQAVFAAHLAGCEECAAEVRALREVTGVLDRGVPQRTPSPELRQRVLASLPGVQATSAPATSRTTESARNWLPLAATIALAVGTVVYAARLQTRVADLETRLEQAVAQTAQADQAVADARRVSSELQSAMGVLAAPDLVRIDLAGQPTAPTASARALWSRARGMVFTASNLPPLPEGRVYQVWVVTGQAPVSAGLLMPDPAGGGSTFFSTSPDIAPPTAVAVTIEPAGGLPAPTGQFYLLGTPGAV
ncbi:MAG: hypothetical protein HOP16_06570 [Acidobacteria bacterium]|nr:hypothetical protein [Acidobacteriota bacterium]